MKASGSVCPAGAIGALAEVVSDLAVSSVYETAPMYVTAQPAFLNAAATGTVTLGPQHLLAAVKAVERRLGRAPAIRFGDLTLSYAQLNEQANRFAHHLMSIGVREKMPVALCCPRSTELYVAILGILKAG